ncbi:MAG TPA: hypothetical protein ENK21_02995 [Trueperaceae bacterium]|nr:hypothetical protein [Trueperaceae bacterium]
MKQLSTSQAKVFSKLKDHKRRTGQLPVLSVLATELGIHYVSLKQHLDALAKKGYLILESRGRGKAPYIELPSECIGLPVLGSIRAGSLSEAYAEAEQFLPLLGFDERYFALRVEGNSMADLIQDKDIVILEKRLPNRSGEICAVRVGESEATLKYLDKLKDGYLLRPHNPDFASIKIANEDIHIEGVYKGLIRGEVSASLVKEREYYY